MDHAINVYRLHFAFTATFHYLFPQLTMGLAPLIVYLKTQALRTADDHYNRSARFWSRIFAINFTLGVVTGIPMEFQFGLVPCGAVTKSSRLPPEARCSLPFPFCMPVASAAFIFP